MGLSEFARVERRFWELIRDGLSPREAGVVLGVSGHTGYRWLLMLAG